jgi:hypothetical protein
MKRIEKKALFKCASKESIFDAFRVTNPKKPMFDIIDSVGQKPTRTNWIHIGTIIFGGEGERSKTTMFLKGLCDIEYGTEKFTRFTAEYDTEIKSGVINLLP